jgi:hypothetical protein
MFEITCTVSVGSGDMNLRNRTVRVAKAATIYICKFTLAATAFV